MQLTKEQSQIVADNHNLIYWYIKMYKLDINEYYDLLAIELCNTAVKHNPDRGSFANYFKLRADGIMYKEYRKTQAQKRVHTNVSFVENMHTLVDETDLLDVLHLKELMNGEEGQVLRLRSEGYSQTEIAEMLGTNQSRISKIIKKLKTEYEERCREVE